MKKIKYILFTFLILSLSILSANAECTKEEINTLSNRVDKHNNLVERMAKVEDSAKSAHHRITELSEGGK